ncbi:hypothetical protein DXH78_13290 [Undibacter mobilis]|uniref:Uncharacterized protein n=1 Tax=Undibacter mobilis TaxID=2292256 RepID=A0A371BDJ0_9BRAD|nr:hypothetical protein DXH78_13290 [Undibacter mobilis]
MPGRARLCSGVAARLLVVLSRRRRGRRRHRRRRRGARARGARRRYVPHGRCTGGCRHGRIIRRHRRTGVGAAVPVTQHQNGDQDHSGNAADPSPCRTRTGAAAQCRVAQCRISQRRVGWAGVETRIVETGVAHGSSSWFHASHGSLLRRTFARRKSCSGETGGHVGSDGTNVGLRACKMV